MAWVLGAFFLGLFTARPTWNSATAGDRYALGVLVGAVYAAFTALVVGTYKYFKRNPSPLWNSRSWWRKGIEKSSAFETYEEHLYGMIANELESEAVDKGLWMKLYVQAGGDDKKTRILYIKERFARLAAEQK